MGKNHKYYEKRQLSKDLQNISHALIDIQKKLNVCFDVVDHLTCREMEAKRQQDYYNGVVRSLNAQKRRHTNSKK